MQAGGAVQLSNSHAPAGCHSLTRPASAAPTALPWGSALTRAGGAGEAREKALAAFYDLFKEEPLVLNKWLTLQVRLQPGSRV